MSLKESIQYGIIPAETNYRPGPSLSRRAPGWMPDFGARVFVKREYEFWHAATVESLSGLGVGVVFDNMDFVTVDSLDVFPLTLAPGDLAFVGHWLVGGYPAFVDQANGPVVQVRYIDYQYGQHGEGTQFLRDVRIYLGPVDNPFQSGDRVFAYYPRGLTPPLPLLYPGVVSGVHFEVCLEIDFEDGEQTLIPVTLVRPLELRPGQEAFVRDDQWTYHPCKVLEMLEDEAVVEFARGHSAARPLRSLGILPPGYRIAGAAADGRG